jgi:hypothetical protein
MGEEKVSEELLAEVEKYVGSIINSVNGRDLKLLVYGLAKRLVRYGYVRIEVVYEGDPTKDVRDLVLRLNIGEKIAVDLWIEARGGKGVVMDYDVYPYTFKGVTERNRIIYDCLELFKR